MIGKVESVAMEGDGVVVNVDSGGVIIGDAVVLALGPWTSKITKVSSKFSGPNRPPIISGPLVMLSRSV